ncbi:hypothetical protein CIB48_g7604 [Xylaria polymorpha]|nr:hypothetical protein CIB48_g7604 [Xylaria polymorpha]
MVAVEMRARWKLELGLTISVLEMLAMGIGRLWSPFVCGQRNSDSHVPVARSPDRSFDPISARVKPNARVIRLILITEGQNVARLFDNAAGLEAHMGEGHLQVRAVEQLHL